MNETTLRVILAVAIVIGIILGVTTYPTGAHDAREKRRGVYADALDIGTVVCNINNGVRLGQILERWTASHRFMYKVRVDILKDPIVYNSFEVKACK